MDDIRKKLNESRPRATQITRKPTNPSYSSLEKAGPSRKDLSETTYGKPQKQMSGTNHVVQQPVRQKTLPYSMTPKEVLDCSYLRLSEAKITEMEDKCKNEGIDPGVHKHMNYEKLAKVKVFQEKDEERTEKKPLRTRPSTLEKK